MLAAKLFQRINSLHEPISVEKELNKVRHRLNREDFIGSNPFVEEDQDTLSRWYVFDSYDFIEQEGGRGYFEAAKNAKISRRYHPLIETPHLFLEFARLYEARNVDNAIREWIGKYGLLGLQRFELQEDTGEEDWLGSPKEDPPRFPGIMYSIEGGPQDTLVNFRREVYRANLVLTAYEEVLSKDVENSYRGELDLTTDEERLTKAFLEEDEADEYAGPRLSPTREATEALILVSLGRLSVHMQDILEAFTFPRFTLRKPSTPESVRGWWTPKLLSPSWGYHNLLGAMYLQFYWLTTSASDLSRCKHCTRAISYAQPIARNQDRKPRKDKEFCDSRCRQNYHYHNRIKPNRNGKS